jgi:hypothetical protein
MLLRQIENEFGRWDELGEHLRRHSADRDAADKAQRRADRADKKIDESLQRQRAARVAREERLKRLSSLYDRALKQIIDPAAGGIVQRDARGLHPAPDLSIAPGGATLGSLANVLALDLAYLSAMVGGIGHLPGFMIHDSPENIVMESALYNRLLRYVLNLETAFGDGPIGFQYLVTTTAPPPPEMAGAPYVVLPLDARSDATLLLGGSY